MLKLTVWVPLAVMAAVTLATAAPAPEPDDDLLAAMEKMMAMLYDKRSIDEDGYSFESLGDGQYRQEVGMILHKGTKDETKVVMGQYAYKDAFGKTQHYVYVADKNGYRVSRAKNKDNLRKATLSLLG